MKQPFNIINMSPRYSAIWKYGVNLHQALLKQEEFMSKYELTFIDLWKDEVVSHNPIKRALQLIQGIKINAPEDSINLYTLPLLTRSMEKTPAKKNLMMVHDLYPLSKNEGLLLHSLCKYLYGKIKLANVILTNSVYTTKEYAQYYGSYDTNPIPLGIEDMIYFKMSEKYRGKQLTLLSIGRDEPRKNLSFMIEVLNKLQIQGVPFRLLRVGEFSKENKELIKRYMLEEKIQVMTKISDQELVDLYSMSHFLLFPSIEEGFGLPPVEAMCCGCLPITSKNGSLPEITGIPELNLDLNSDLWASTIVALSKLTEERKDLKEQCKQQSIKYSWKNYADTLTKILREKLV